MMVWSVEESHSTLGRSWGLLCEAERETEYTTEIYHSQGQAKRCPSQRICLLRWHTLEYL